MTLRVLPVSFPHSPSEPYPASEFAGGTKPSGMSLEETS